MTDKEISSIIRTLKAYYPYYYRDVTTPEQAKEVMEVWRTHFGEFDYELVKKAVDKWGGKNSSAPSIADLKSTLFSFYSEIDWEIKDAEPEKAEKLEKWRQLIWIKCRAK